MPTAVLEPDIQEPVRKRWTRSDCAILEAHGAWEQLHLELINGELISKMGKNRPHSITLSLVFEWLIGVFSGKFVNSETTVDVSPEDNPTNEPQPDLVVFNRPASEMRLRNPTPSDIHLIVEISDTSLSFDMRVKGTLYARAGIEEYWIADIAARRIIVHRDPQDGVYRSVEAYSAEETVSPLAAPDQTLPVSCVFPE